MRRRRGEWSEWDEKVMKMRGQTPEDWARMKKESVRFVEALHAKVVAELAAPLLLQPALDPVKPTEDVP